MRAMVTALPPILVDDLPATRRSLRVALVTETYPPEVNGVALTLQRVVDGLHARHHDIQLVRPRQTARDEAADGDRYNEVLMRGIPIPRYPDLKMGAPSKAALVRLWTLRRPDLVYIATEGPLGWSALHAAQRLRLPMCSDFRTNFHAYSKHYGVGWLYRPIMAYLRKFHNRTAFTMVPTEHLRQELARVGFERLVVAARGVDTALFDPARRSEALRQSWGVAPDADVALYVGRLAPEKNLGLLVAAYHAMRQVQPGLRLVLVGDGPARQALTEAMPDAVFAGTRYGEALAQHYASADLFVFPSMTETFGNVTVEALSSGLPVLAYDHAAAAALVRSGHNGLLARLDDSAEFVRLASQLAADRGEAARMGVQARQTACGFGWDRAVDQIETVLHATLAAAALPGTTGASARAVARAI
jgi:glycosyltransferase involved in cell wall biosynthesis